MIGGEEDDERQSQLSMAERTMQEGILPTHQADLLLQILTSQLTLCVSHKYYFFCCSKRIFSLLLGFRIQGGASAITRTSAFSSYQKNTLLTNSNRALFGTSSDSSNMSDEVVAAKAAAAQYKSSDADGEFCVCT